MKLSSKKDVRHNQGRATTLSNSMYLFSFKGFFKSFFPSKTSRHNRYQVKKIKLNSQPSEPSSDLYHTSKDYGVRPLNHSKNNQVKSSVLSFITLASLILTASTLFYFFEVSNKIVAKKEVVIDLYKKYESIKAINQKSKIILSSLAKTGEVEGQLMLIVDTSNMVEKQADKAKQAYLKHKKLEQLEMTHSYIIKVVLLALILVVSCILLRIFLLIKEITAIDLDENKEVFV